VTECMKLVLVCVCPSFQVYALKQYCFRTSTKFRVQRLKKVVVQFHLGTKYPCLAPDSHGNNEVNHSLLCIDLWTWEIFSLVLQITPQTQCSNHSSSVSVYHNPVIAVPVGVIESSTLLQEKLSGCKCGDEHASGGLCYVARPAQIRR
jgi:hypothetical protein